MNAYNETQHACATCRSSAEIANYKENMTWTYTETQQDGEIRSLIYPNYVSAHTILRQYRQKHANC